MSNFEVVFTTCLESMREVNEQKMGKMLADMMQLGFVEMKPVFEIFYNQGVEDGKGGKELLARVDTTLNIVEMLTQDVGFYSLPQDIQKKINWACRNLEEAYELLEVEANVNRYTQVEALFKFIERGGEEHREWLKEALHCFFNEQPKPDYRA